MIYANAVSGTFQAVSHTNLSQVWLNPMDMPPVSWMAITSESATKSDLGSAVSLCTPDLDLRSIAVAFSEFVRAGWMVSEYLPVESINVLPFTAQRIEHAKAARQLVREFGALTENWDGYGASPISQQARRHAARFIDIIEASPSGLSIPDISPMPSGTIAFEWETQGTTAYLEIGNTRFSGYIRIDRQAPILLQGLADYLDQEILSTIQRAISTPVSPSASITEIHT